MSPRAVFREALKSLGAAAVCLVVLEGVLRLVYVVRNSAVDYVPLPYVFGHAYGPVPPWVDGLRLLEPDRQLIWKGRPNVRRKYVDVFSPVWTERERTDLLRQLVPRVPESLRANPVWTVSLNSLGFRDDEFPKTKGPSALRILCIGDSWTFGANVAQEQAYPRRLRALLEERFPGASFEVLNLGVLGYSSAQGLELLKGRGLVMAPDVILIGFAMNDGSAADYRDRDLIGHEQRWSSETGGLARSETYKLMRYLAQRFRFKPKSPSDQLGSIGEYVEAVPEAAAMPDYQKLQPRTRVPLPEYEGNLAEMIRLARGRGASVALLYDELAANSPYRVSLRRVAETEGVPLVDGYALVAEARGRIERDLEARLDLQPSITGAPAPPSADGVNVVFRVYAGDRPVPKALYIAGTDPAIGENVPNQVALHDDATHGDQRPGDHVWSLAVTLPRKPVFYVYTNSGAPGKWEGLDVPDIRGFRVDAANPTDMVYRPIETFGMVYMQADSWHTNSAGYELIARAVVEILTRDDRVRRQVGQRDVRP